MQMVSVYSGKDQVSVRRSRWAAGVYDVQMGKRSAQGKGVERWKSA